MRTWTASDRAKHRVFEKGRREAFNERLMDLARLLPALSTAKESQLSKHVIVDESVKQHQAQAALIESLRIDVDRVLAEHRTLLNEFNAFREAINSQSTHADSSVVNAHSDNIPASGPPAHTSALPPTQAASSYGAPYINRGDEWIMDTHDAMASEAFHRGGVDLQVSPAEQQNGNPTNSSLNASTILQGPLVFDTASSLSFQGVNSGGFPEGLQITQSPTMGYFDAFRFQMSDNGNWSQNPQMNTFEIFNIDQGGTTYPSTMTHG